MSKRKIIIRLPKKVADNAKIGLKPFKKYGRGGAHIGFARARDLKIKRNLSKDTINRIVKYFSIPRKFRFT